MSKRFPFATFVCPGAALAFAAALVSLSACGDPAPGRSYYERQIEPILLQTCARNTGGCHSTNVDDPFEFAAGNLDVTSFESVQKRRDVLKPVGAYSQPLLLIKAVGGSNQLQVAYGDAYYDLEVSHVGGAVMQVGSDAYLTLLEWTENGATKNGLPPPDPPREGGGACSTQIPPEFDPVVVTGNPQLSGHFDTFKDDVEPILDSCRSGNCHGAPQSDFYVTCGRDEAQQAFNFVQVQAFVADPVDNSQILQVPLAVSAGGYFHSGGEHFASRNGDDRYETLEAWAEAVGPVQFGAGDAGKQFFAEHVQPMLLRRGCMFLACHSPTSTNDFKLRSGSQGFFSAIALERNYQLTRDLFMAVEMPSAARGRAVSKTIVRRDGGIAHRGGAVLGQVEACGAFDPDPRVTSPYCFVQEWINRERAPLVTAGQLSDIGGGAVLPIVFIRRSAQHLARPREFDTFQPNSDLRVVDATFDAGGSITGVANDRSLLGACGVDPATVDVRSPDVRFDGNTVTFAMWQNATNDALGVYTTTIDGTGPCQRITPYQAPVQGIRVHNFDPAWSPDGSSIVFASTRGGAQGPSVTRRYFLPQSDIWRMNADGSGATQVTFLTNSELSPQMMREGRIIMTTEKIAPSELEPAGFFYQLSGRRINWDRTDYHPLLAQRAMSPFGDPDDPAAMRPSVGYAQATEIRESLNGNFLLVLSDPEARGGAGTLAIFNRSAGTFEEGRDTAGFLESMVIPDRRATGRARPDTMNADTDGAYRSPFPLPDGRILVSHAAVQGDLAGVGSLDWDLMMIDPSTPNATPAAIPGMVDNGAEVEAVLAFKSLPGELYENRRQLVFGGAVDPALGPGEATLHLPDAPLIFTLVNANLRRGRPVELFRSATHVKFYRENVAPPQTTAGNTPSGIYLDRTPLGQAALAADGSVRVSVPAGQGIVMELLDDSGAVLQTMREEHQLGPGESISFGINALLYDATCGGCHGSISGKETDIAVIPVADAASVAPLVPDVLTGASLSLSSGADPVSLE